MPFLWVLWGMAVGMLLAEIYILVCFPNADKKILCKSFLCMGSAVLFLILLIALILLFVP